MRPMKLNMQAFGPYAGLEVIDFSHLGNRTMFVISGKTGSGKTTIFDGISFAIYGRASGDDRMGTDLRSQFADDDVLTEVSLEFSLKGDTYYIWRSPQQERRKRRGDGFTTLNAQAELYVIEDGERKLLAANVRDTDEKIKEIIQLDANQFRQILMIPQGDFRKLLTSDSKEKEGILQRLFHTVLYKRVEEKLREDANVLKKQVEAGGEERSRILKNIASHGNEQLESALAEDPMNDTHILTLLSEILIEMSNDSKILVHNIEKQKQKRDEAKRHVDTAEDLLKQMSVRDDLTRRKTELKEKEAEITQMTIEIEMANKANKLQHQEELCQRLKNDLDRSELQLSAETENMRKMESEFEIAREKLMLEEKKTEKRDQLNEELLKLKNLQEEVYSFASRKSALAKIEKDLFHSREKISDEKIFLSKLQLSLNEKENEMKELELHRTKTFELEKKQIAIELALNQLHMLENSIKKEATVNEQLKAKNEELEKVKKVAEDARDTLYIIEEQWHKGQAGILAKTLADGTPCPVCGSLEHPAPSVQSEGHITEVDLKAAKSSVEIANLEVVKVESSLLKDEAEAKFLQEKTAETLAGTIKHIPDFRLEEKDAYLFSYEENGKETKRLLGDSQLKVQQIPKLEEQISTLKIEQDKRNKQLENLVELERQLSISHSEAFAGVSNLSRIIPEELRTKENYDKKVSDIAFQINILKEAFEVSRTRFLEISERVAGLKGTIKSLQTQVLSGKEGLAVERTLFLEMMEAEKFISYKHYHESKKTASQLKALDGAIRSFHEEFRSITDRLHDYQSRLKDIEKPDLLLLEGRFKQAEQTYISLSEQQSTLAMQINKNEEIRETVQSINEQIKTFEEEYELIGHLADITRGQNTYRLSFERFVLASFLDGILEAANVRLVKMTSGRYQLLRKTDRSKGNVQSGLELLVFDQYTGQERHVKTLSGGESFKAALSLALGLADVVQEHAGGVSMETMFIDEGFGTLDPESLDHAIEALMDIQSSGRLVGIISHVPELKERIDARLEVIAYQNGSKTEFRFSG